MQRSIAFSDKLSIYFRTAPRVIGETVFLFSLYWLISLSPTIENIAGSLLLLSVGGYFIYRKVRVSRKASSVLRTGIKTEAVLAWIIDTNTEHNSRIVKEYLFEYQVGGDKYSYEYRSAYKRHLKIGDRMPIFYLPENPKESFIPKLYNIYIR